MDYGTGINPKGLSVTLTECSLCGSVYAQGAKGHSATGDVVDTELHKVALADKNRTAR